MAEKSAHDMKAPYSTNTMPGALNTVQLLVAARFQDGE